MSKQNSNLADYIMSLPQKVLSLQQQSEAIIAETKQIEAILSGLDRAKLDNLFLTGNIKLDVALRLSMESGWHGEDWLKVFPQILERLEQTEQKFATWKDGGLAFIDRTGQTSCPPCPEWTIVEVKAGTIMQIVTGQSYFYDIPINVQIIGRPLLRVSYTDWEIKQIGTLNDSIISLTPMFHPNWGTFRHSEISGVFLGEKAVAEHIDQWKKFFEEGYGMGDNAKKYYLDFLEKFRFAVQNLSAV